MEAPKCQYCGKKEWRHICDQTPVMSKSTLTGGKVSPPVEAPSDSGKKAVHVPVVDRIEPVMDAQHETAGDKPKFDRNAYQREYMRKRRHD